MTTCPTAALNPEQAWLKQAFFALEQSFGQPLELWISTSDGLWCLDNESSLADSQSPSLDLMERLKSAAQDGSPSVLPIGDGEYFVAVPLTTRDTAAQGVATATIATDSPDLLLSLAKMSQGYFQKQQQVIRLREENDYFLKQVSDDFEELTFLRAMAEHLSLDDSNRTIDELIAKAVPMLGDSVNCESLYFIDGSGAEPEVKAAWHADGLEDIMDDSMVRDLVEDYRIFAEQQPVIRNQFPGTRIGVDFPGIREFALVSSSTAMGQVGWLLAVNRCHGDEQMISRYPAWRLSQNEFGSCEASLLNTAGAMLASHANNLSLFREREALLVNVVRTLVFAIEAKDRYTCGHSERVALYGKLLAQQVGYDHDACELLYLTGLLHDIGKIAVSDAVLNKPDRLTDEEFEEIKRHPDEGWKILQELEQLNYVLPGVLHHHERPDGTGYPDQLTGDTIPLDGRVLAVADAYDAMTSDRAYREGMSQTKAEEILRAGAGTQWDPAVIDAFFEIVPEIVTIRENYQLRERPEREPAPLA